ncbi:MAG TPA: hypothetical protein VLJ39_09485 [Tepidisphaeraceae bacterium]|jgi:hypothetical protein|nr:hypothetical protein [Tepidisphaeraceae bacterium]
MSRKKFAPSSWRRCAIFLALVGTSTVGAGRLRAGVYAGEPSKDWAESQLSFGATSHLIGVQNYQQDSKVVGQKTSAQSADASRPDMTGENWFLGLQEDLGQSLNSEQNDRPLAAPVTKADPAATPGNATAIPSLPSFWSGFTCCVALVVAGMIPRIRRAFR